MIVRMQRFIGTFLLAHVLQRPIANHLVGIHVGRRASAALNDVHDELLVQLAAN